MAIFAQTREEWAIADLAIALAGAVSVPVYPTLTAEQVGHVLVDSGARAAFVEGAEQRDVVLAESRADLVRIVVFDAAAVGGDPRVVSLGELGRPERAADVAAREAQVRPGDLATIIYTSGTSGQAKGVMLTHGALAHEIEALGSVLPLTARDEQLLFLPLAHVLGRVLLLAALEVGYATAFARSLAHVLDDLAEVEPTFFASVPRLYEKIHAVAVDNASSEGPVKERLYRWAIRVGAERSAAARSGGWVGPRLAVAHRYADQLVLSKVRARFGRRLRFAISGGAPLARELAEWFHACGVLVLEGYGLTETCAATHVNRPGAFRFGTVGQPVPGVEVAIAADGEVLLRGPTIMRGYFGQPDATADALDAQGYLHSGDIGRVDADGFLAITDRKKDMIVTAGGKNVAPQNLEAMLQKSPWIEQAVILGDGRKHLVALIALDVAAATRWAREHGRPDDLASLSHDPELRALVEIDVDAVNRKLAKFEAIKRFAILDRELTIEGGELTPTHKVRRKVVEARWASLLDSLYAG